MSLHPPLFDTIAEFLQRLREAGIPVSMVEALDAMHALEHVEILDREEFKWSLAATLVKHAHHYDAFATVFDVYFSLLTAAGHLAEGEDGEAVWLSGEAPQGQPGGQADTAELVEALLRALLQMDQAALRRLAAAAVNRFAGIEPGRPVGGTYYLYRTLRQLDLDGLMAKLAEEFRRQQEADRNEDTGQEWSPLDERLLSDEVKARIEALKEELRDEIRRRLVADRGAEAMARTLQKPLLEDVDFMHATSAEMRALRRAITPLTRKLAARLAQRRKHGKTGRLDVRNTMRHSLSTGGVPVEPKFRYPKPSRPEVFLVCDISGSVASFARFTMQLMFAMSEQFSKIRSFVFIDGLDEVTATFERATDFQEAILAINTEAKVVWVDGHSNYGHALAVFQERYGSTLSPKSSLIITGDARNNYHTPEPTILKELRRRARNVYWLNPEPKSYWNTGDSIVGEYATYCDGTFECRNLRQLEKFVDYLA